MSLSTQPYKGARDFFPEEKRLQKYMFSKLRQTVESFGYEEYDAPILEPIELYLAKSGEEIVNEQTYNFTDRGGRDVVIRPEMTPTVSRMVAARRQELGYPLRWYSIPNLWRYERPQRGRWREHWQLKVDLFGVAGTAAELEMITLVDNLYKNFQATADMYRIQVNSRQLTNYILSEYLSLSDVEAQKTGKLIDRMNKISTDDFRGQLFEILDGNQQADDTVEKLIQVLGAKRVEDLPELVQKQGPTDEVRTLMDNLKSAGINNAVFDPTLMRGFDYYTGIVFEVSDTHPDNNRSMMGGGRYDGLVGLFGVEPVPTIGFGLGDATLANFLELHNLLPTLEAETDLYIVPVGDVSPSDIQSLAARLRSAGLNIAVDLSGRKIGDMFKTAEKKQITRCLVVGEKELAGKSYSMKNLATGNADELTEQQIIDQLLTS